MSHKQPDLKHITDIARSIKETADAQDAVIRQMWEVTQAVASGNLPSSMMAQAQQIIANPVAQGIIRGMSESFDLSKLKEKQSGTPRLKPGACETASAKQSPD